METYFQEIGRAGHCGEPAMATLYYNNSEIASNKTNIDDSMRMYCQCYLPMYGKLLEYFGFSYMKQKKCCSVCNGHYDALQLPENKLGQTEQKKKIRLLSAAQASKLYEDIASGGKISVGKLNAVIDPHSQEEFEEIVKLEL